MIKPWKIELTLAGGEVITEEHDSERKARDRYLNLSRMVGQPITSAKTGHPRKLRTVLFVPGCDGEEVQLYGGPMNGRRLWIKGGDELHFAYLPSAGPIMSNGATPPDYVRFADERAVYRRSLVNRSTFVFQP